MALTDALSGLLSDKPDTSALTSATANDRARADEFYRRLALLQQNYQQQLAAQAGLTRQLDRTIAGTAPSVAGTQLQRGVGQIADAARASAAGAGGNNAALANYGAIQAMAQAQSKANQDASILRAKEVADAQMAKANVLNQMQGATGTQSGQATGAATGLSGTETSGAGAIAGANAQETASERNLLGNLAGSAGVPLLNYALNGPANPTPAPKTTSDENAKTDKKPIADNDMDAFLKHISGFSFKYKPEEVGPNAPPGNRVGQMAQDVQKGGPVGRAVSDGKEIDLRNAVGALLAAVAHVNSKVENRA